MIYQTENLFFILVYNDVKQTKENFFLKYFSIITTFSLIFWMKLFWSKIFISMFFSELFVRIYSQKIYQKKSDQRRRLKWEIHRSSMKRILQLNSLTEKISYYLRGKAFFSFSIVFAFFSCLWRWVIDTEDSHGAFSCHHVFISIVSHSSAWLN